MASTVSSRGVYKFPHRKQKSAGPGMLITNFPVTIWNAPHGQVARMGNLPCRKTVMQLQVSLYGQEFTTLENPFLITKVVLRQRALLWHD